MRNLAVGAILACVAGTAAAGGDPFTEARYADGNDYSARLFYAMDFGGTVANDSRMGLRFDNVLASSRGAPALFAAEFKDQALPVLSLQGVPVAGPALAAGQTETGFFGNLTMAQMFGLGFTALVFGAIVVEAADSEDDEITGTGAN